MSSGMDNEMLKTNNYRKDTPKNQRTYQDDML